MNTKGKLKTPDCGTAACLAGTAAAFSLNMGEVMSGSDIYGFDGEMEGRFPITREWRAEARSRGQEVLGLTDYQATALFYLTPENLGLGGNGDPLPAIRLVASYITGRDFRKVGL